LLLEPVLARIREAGNEPLTERHFLLTNASSSGLAREPLSNPRKSAAKRSTRST